MAAGPAVSLTVGWAPRTGPREFHQSATFRAPFPACAQVVIAVWAQRRRWRIDAKDLLDRSPRHRIGAAGLHQELRCPAFFAKQAEQKVLRTEIVRSQVAGFLFGAGYCPQCPGRKRRRGIIAGRIRGRDVLQPPAYFALIYPEIRQHHQRNTGLSSEQRVQKVLRFHSGVPGRGRFPPGRVHHRQNMLAGS